MLLVVNMDAPKNCSGCCLMGSPNCPYDGSKAMGSDYPNCPIIGEIPYELGNFIIGMSQLPREKPKTATEAKEALAYEELERRMKKEMQNGSDN